MNVPRRILSSPERVRLSVANFMLLAESGAFADYTKVELVDGDIYVMNAQDHPHAQAKSRLMVALAIRLKEIGSDLEAVSEVSVRLDDASMPEPDIVLKRWQGAGPVPIEAVALVVEVSDTTLALDLGRKAELYAAAGVHEYWVVDLHGRRVLMHACPEDGAYPVPLDVPFGQPLIAATVGGLEVESGALVA